MSLCPNYCECGGCDHGYKLCEDCPECIEEYLRKIHQKNHEESVIKQKMKLKIAPWYRRGIRLEE